MDLLKWPEEEILYNAVATTNATTPVYSSPDKVTLEIADLYNNLFVQSCDKKESEVDIDKELIYIKLIALRNHIFSITTPHDRDPDFFLISSLFTHISNTIVAVVKLADEGFDYQALSLMRNLTELYMTLLTVVESPQKRLEYERAADAESAREVWHKFFNKKHFIQMLDSYFNYNSEAKCAYKNWVDDIYSELSSFAHNDYAYLICYSFAIGKNEGNPLNLWGEYVSRRKMVYQHLMKVIAPAELLLGEMLNDGNIDISFRDLFENSDTPEVIGTMNLQLTISNASKIILMDYIKENPL